VMSKKTEDFPYASISAMQWKSGLTLGTITVLASGARMEITNVDKKAGAAIVELVRGRIGTVGPVAATAPPVAGLGEQLAHLAQLHGQGVLNDEEFSQAKARLLA
jgi:hypothetical protein